MLLFVKCTNPTTNSPILLRIHNIRNRIDINYVVITLVFFSFIIGS